MNNQQETLHSDRLIIATNRGPVEYTLTKEGDLKQRRGSGGVVTALLGSVHSLDAAWIAFAMTDGDRRAVQQAPDGVLDAALSGQQMQLRYVVIPKQAYRKYYESICDQVLWFLQHYLLDRTETPLGPERIQDAWENGYQVANQAIAETICTEIESGEGTVTVLLNDYHLYLAPALIRERHPSTVMQHFIHIPWPEVRYWQSTLPGAFTLAIFQGLLGNNIIGFQTRRDAQNFLEGVDELLEEAEVDHEERSISWQGRVVQVRDYPISISVDEERRTVRSAAGKRASAKIKPLLAEQNIMRVDRIEPTKNIVRGFQAYEYLLEQHPDLHGKVTFLAFLVPSRESLRIYKRYKEEVLKIIEQVNDHFGTEDWQPIQPFIQNDRTQALAALQYYDVLMVNALIDGMNLVAKEGPVLNQRDGLLLLSRTSGAFQQLESAALPISPSDVLETADVLYQALTLSSSERHEKAALARKNVEQCDLADWIQRQIHDLNALGSH